MAKKITSEDIKLNLIVNGNQAQAEYAKLGRTIRDANYELKAVKSEMKALEAEGKANTESYKDLNKQMVALEKTISTSIGKQKELTNQMKVEDRSIEQLKQSITTLRSLRSKADPNSEAYKKYNAELIVAKNRLRELEVGTDQTGNAIVRMTNKLNQHIGALVAGGASLVAFWAGTKYAIDEYAAFDDVLTDVMKTTNLTKDSVKELNQELTQIETRTSQEDLLGLSRIAGKLGYDNITEITEFVRANNQIIVALNEDLGGNVEETVNKIGKLVDIFKLKDLYTTEEAFLKVGSAINELGMASTANEGYMVEFARRMAGVAPLAGITIEEILGLGAALDQLGQTEEVSSTALSKLFLNIAKDAETYSKYAGMKVNDFKNLLEKDFMSAFKMVLRGVKDNSEGLNQLAATLGDLGEDGGRVIGVIGSLANNVDTLTESVELSYKAMRDGTSITQEYGIKNESAAAKLEIAQKKVKALWIELGERLRPVMTSGLNVFSIFIKMLSSTVRFISDNSKVLATLIITIAAYYTALQIAAKWQMISNTAMAAKKILVTGASVAYGLLTGNLTRAAAAQQLLNMRMMANPYGIAAALLAALVSGLILFRNKTDDAAKSQQDLSKAIEESSVQAERETANLKWNLRILNDETQTRENKLLAIKRLREIMPDVLQDYTDEEILAGKAAKVIRAHAEAIRLRAKARAIEGLIEAKEKLRLEIVDKGLAGYESIDFLEKLGYAWESLFTGKAFKGQGGATVYLEKIEKAWRSNDEVLKGYNKELESTLKLIDEVEVDTTKSKVVDPNKVTITDSKADKKSEKDRREAFRKELEDAEKYQQQLLQKEGLFREDLSELTVAELEKLAKHENDYQNKLDGIHKKYGENLKTVSRTAEKELKRRADAESKYIDSLLIKRQSEADAEKLAYEDRLKKAGLFGVEKEKMTERQLQALEILQKEHQATLDKIDSTAIAKSIDDQKNQHRDLLADLRIQQHEELSQITTLAQAKEVLSSTMDAKQLEQVRTLGQARRLIQNQQQLEEEALTREHLESLLEILRVAQERGQFEGLSLADSVLSEEEKKVLEDRICAIREELAKLTGQDKTIDINPDQARNKVDILGMSIQDWENLFNNIGTSEEKLMGVLGTLEAATQVWGQYNKLVANKEDAQLQKDEASNNKKKENLKRRLDSGAISQEVYNRQIEKMDKDLDRKKAKVARDQAKRERNVALTSAIVNTAKAVTSVLPNFILAAIVGAFGGLQIATIANTPLPVIPGAESGGGFLEVTRAQDGKQFKAKQDPHKRGYVSNPTVLVGENGTEWVANAQAVNNPTVKPILDVLDTAQKNGTINTLNLSEIIAGSVGRTRVTGRQSGGSFADVNATSTIIGTTDPELLKLLKKLDVRLANLKAEVNIAGKGGLAEKQAEYDQIINSSNL